MNNLDDFEEFLKNELESQSAFEFNESDWVKAEKYINLSRKKDKQRKLIYWSVSFIGLIFLGVFIALSNETTEVVYTHKLINKTCKYTKQNHHYNINFYKTEKMNAINYNMAKGNVDSVTHKSNGFEKEHQSVASKNKLLNINANNLSYNIQDHGSKDCSTMQNMNCSNVASNISFKSNQTSGTNISNPVYNNFINEQDQQINLPTICVLNLLQSDSIAELKVDSIQNFYYVVPDRNKNKLYAEIGADYLMGWINNQITDTRGFNPVIGIAIERKLYNKINTSIGLQFTQIGNFKSTITYTTHVAYYDFGVTKDVTEISIKNLQYISMPIKFNFNFNSKNSIGVGAYCSYLINVNNIKNTYQLKMDKLNDAKTTKVNGYRDGINEFDFALSLFYKKKLFKKCFLNAEFIYGLTDIKSNRYFKDNVFENRKGFRVSINYYLNESLW